MTRRLAQRADGQDRLRLADVPLGPWAGAEVQVFATNTGQRWHGDECCQTLKSAARTASHRQPDTGTLADLNLPNLHCYPSGALGEYLQLVQRIIRYARDTDDARTQCDRNDLDLDVLPFADKWSLDRINIADATMLHLGELWKAEIDLRDQLVRDIRRRLDPAGDRLAIMALADWIRDGRTSGRHQERYERFVNIGVAEFHNQDIASSWSTYHQVNDIADTWLSDVIHGRSMDNASEAIIEREYVSARSWPRSADIADRVKTVWTTTYHRWQSTLEAMAAAHPDAALALFHRYGSIAPSIGDWPHGLGSCVGSSCLSASTQGT